MNAIQKFRRRIGQENIQSRFLSPVGLELNKELVTVVGRKINPSAIIFGNDEQWNWSGKDEKYDWTVKQQGM